MDGSVRSVQKKHRLVAWMDAPESLDSGGSLLATASGMTPTPSRRDISPIDHAQMRSDNSPPGIEHHPNLHLSSERY
jgi:hypothetical protein